MNNPEEQSIATLLTDLREDVHERIAAEVALRKAEVSSRVAASKAGIVLIVIAALLVIAALTAMVVGLLLIASIWLNVIWATAITTFAVLALAGLLAKIGASAISRAIAGPEDVL